MSAPWDAEVNIDEPLIRRLLQRQYPELAECSVTLLGQGWDCSAWLVDDRLVFRLPRRQAGADCIQNEIHVLPEVANRLSLLISAPELVGEPCDDFCWPFAATQLIPGISLCDAGIAAADRTAIASQLGIFLRELHAITADEAAEIGAPADELERLDVEPRSQRCRKLLSQAVEAGVLKTDVATSLRHRVDRIVAMNPQPAVRSLVHGDLYSRHIFTINARATGIIDWGDVHIGDPAADLASTWTLFPSAVRKVFFSEYGDVARETLELALLRGMGHSLTCLLYAQEIGDHPLLAESNQSLSRIAFDSL